jgi:hypothetical protein
LSVPRYAGTACFPCFPAAIFRMTTTRQGFANFPFFFNGLMTVARNRVLEMAGNWQGNGRE